MKCNVRFFLRTIPLVRSEGNHGFQIISSNMRSVPARQEGQAGWSWLSFMSPLEPISRLWPLSAHAQSAWQCRAYICATSLLVLQFQLPLFVFCTIQVFLLPFKPLIERSHLLKRGYLSHSHPPNHGFLFGGVKVFISGSLRLESPPSSFFSRCMLSEVAICIPIF